MYIHSIPNNNDNQDIVSMGSNAALIARKVVENTYDVMAIEMMALVQAVDYLKVAGKLSARTQKVYNVVREVFPVFVKDSVKYPAIISVRNVLLGNTGYFL
jgi:histidine ammonia-lyase